MFHHDHAGPHTFLATRSAKIERPSMANLHAYATWSGSETIFLVSSQLVQVSFNGVNLISIKGCKIFSFARNLQSPYSDGIMVLPKKWRKVTDQSQAVQYRYFANKKKIFHFGLRNVNSLTSQQFFWIYAVDKIFLETVNFWPLFPSLSVSFFLVSRIVLILPFRNGKVCIFSYKEQAHFFLSLVLMSGGEARSLNSSRREYSVDGSKSTRRSSTSLRVHCDRQIYI